MNETIFTIFTMTWLIGFVIFSGFIILSKSDKEQKKPTNKKIILPYESNIKKTS